MEESLTFGKWLELQFQLKHQRNSRYSLRAFARDIGLTPGRVSELFHDKRSLSDPKINEIVERLKLRDVEIQTVRKIVTKQRRYQQDKRPFGGETRLPPLKIIRDQEFAVIADPIHYAILALMDGGVAVDEFAKRLAVSEQKVRAALTRLLLVGMIKEKSGAVSGGKNYELVEHWVSTSTDQYSRAIRFHHRHKLKHAIQAIEKVPIEKRDITSWTMCVDPDKMPEAKKIIQSFERKMAKLMTTGKPSEVYHLNIQFVPFHYEEKCND